MKHIAKRRARARRPFPVCITPFRKGVANRRNTTASLNTIVPYHAQKSSPPGREGLLRLQADRAVGALRIREQGRALG